MSAPGYIKDSITGALEMISEKSRYCCSEVRRQATTRPDKHGRVVLVLVPCKK